MKQKFIKTINFDLDTKKLKLHYPNKSYQKAYDDIRKFLEKNGFKHRQWSGYISEKPITDVKMFHLTEKLVNTFPELRGCVNRFDIANFEDNYDLKMLFDEEEIIEDISLESPSNAGIKSLSQWKADIEAVKAEREASDGDVKTRIPTEKER